MRIPRTEVIYKFSNKLKPVAFAKAGDRVIFETRDALSDQISRSSPTLDSVDLSKRNPATGPLFIEGAEAGDTLVVEILKIKLRDYGWMRVYPGGGILHDKDIRHKVKIVELSNDVAMFNDLEIPLNPMVGVVGVAPVEGEYLTTVPNYHGGNMDVAEIGVGSRIYLPVFLDGALLAIGDVHAVQKDGEICSTALETSGEVEIKVDIIKKKMPRYPILETSAHYSIIAFGYGLDEAAYRASEEATRVLMKAQDLEFEEAYMLSSITVGLKVNQAVNPFRGVRAEIPKKYVKLEDFLV